MTRWLRYKLTYDSREGFAFFEIESCSPPVGEAGRFVDIYMRR